MRWGAREKTGDRLSRPRRRSPSGCPAQAPSAALPYDGFDSTGYAQRASAWCAWGSFARPTEEPASVHARIVLSSGSGRKLVYGIWQAIGGWRGRWSVDPAGCGGLGSRHVCAGLARAWAVPRGVELGSGCCFRGPVVHGLVGGWQLGVVADRVELVFGQCAGVGGCCVCWCWCDGRCVGWGCCRGGVGG